MSTPPAIPVDPDPPEKLLSWCQGANMLAPDERKDIYVTRRYS